MPNPQVTVDFTGQLHNRCELVSELGLDHDEAEEANLLRYAWLRWGEAMAEHLIGDYALALYDPQRRLTYLARDPLGVKPLYYRVDKGELGHGFSIPDLRRRTPLPVTQDVDWAAAYLLGLSFSQTESAYKEIGKLAPGHWLTCDAAGRVRIQRYHHWRDDAPPAAKRDPRWVEAYRAVLEESIRCRMDLDAPMGTENSGGIDSATVTAYLAHFLGEPGDRLYSFSFALCEQEPSYILETSQARRIRHNYILTDRGADDDEARVARGLAVLGYPEEHGNGSGHLPFYEESRRRGIRALFSGFGGDEVVTNSGHHLRYELLDQHRYGALWDILPGDPIRRALRLVKAATVGRRNPERNPNFDKAWNQRWPHQLVRPELIRRLNLYERYMDTAIYDAPYRRVDDFILHHHLKRMQLTARLENCTVMAAAYGVDYRWPLWDARLVQQYLSTPGIEKVGPKGIGRYLHRRAIDGVVPRRVAWKPSKDMGYARLQQEMNHNGIVQVAESARRLATRLHPAIEELIDPDKFREQIERAALGQADGAFAFAFRRSTHAARWLNAWFSNEAQTI